MSLDSVKKAALAAAGLAGLGGLVGLIGFTYARRSRKNLSGGGVRKKLSKALSQRMPTKGVIEILQLEQVELVELGR